MNEAEKLAVVLHSSSENYVASKMYDSEKLAVLPYDSSQEWLAPKDEALQVTPYTGSQDWLALKAKKRVVGSHTSSWTWVAPKSAVQEEFEAWLVVEEAEWEFTREGLTEMDFIRSSPFVPTTFNEWLQHRAGLLEDARKEGVRKLDAMKTAGPDNVRILPPFQGKQFWDNRGTVLSEQTIWTPNYMPTNDHPQAPWPSLEEMKEEGDERNTSGFGRFPALPRVPPGNETVGWKQRNVVNAYPFDNVWPLPIPKEQEEEEEYDAEYMEKMLGKDLLAHIDA